MITSLETITLNSDCYLSNSKKKFKTRDVHVFTNWCKVLEVTLLVMIKAKEFVQGGVKLSTLNYLLTHYVLLKTRRTSKEYR